jgi:hypothetical protein
MRTTAGLAVYFAGAWLALSIFAARSQSPVTNSLPPATPAEKLTDKLYPKWKLGGVPIRATRYS